MHVPLWRGSGRTQLFTISSPTSNSNTDMAVTTIRLPTSKYFWRLEKGQAMRSFVQSLRIEFIDPDECSTSSRHSGRANVFQTIIYFLPKLDTLILTELQYITDEFLGGDANPVYEPKASLRKLVMCRPLSPLSWIWPAWSYIGELQVLDGGNLSGDLAAFSDSSFPKLGALTVDWISGSPGLRFKHIIPASCVVSSLERLEARFSSFMDYGNTAYFQRLFHLVPRISSISAWILRT